MVVGHARAAAEVRPVGLGGRKSLAAPTCPRLEPDAGRASALRPSRLPIQRKLAVGHSDDPLEREADRAAELAISGDRVPRWRASGPTFAVGPSGWRRPSQSLVSGSGGAPVVSEAPPIVDAVLASGGRPLDRQTRTYFEPQFGIGLSAVRLHDDERAADSAAAVDARAYAVGPHIVLGRGTPELNTVDGRRLLAHELAHVVQQRSSLAGGSPPVLGGGDLLERTGSANDRQKTRLSAFGAPVLRRTPGPKAVSPRVKLDLSDQAEYHEFSRSAITFWRVNPDKSCQDFASLLATEANSLLTGNGVPAVDPFLGSAAAAGALAVAFFDRSAWSITLDISAIGQKPNRPTVQLPIDANTKMRALGVDDVVALAGACYHEARHAEQAFKVARLIAEQAKAAKSPKATETELEKIATTIGTALAIPARIARAALSTKQPLSREDRAEAEAWRTEEPGGRHSDYWSWNEGFRNHLYQVIQLIPWEKLQNADVDYIWVMWDQVIHPFMEGRRDKDVRPVLAMIRNKEKIAPRDRVDDDVLGYLHQIDSDLTKARAEERTLDHALTDARSAVAARKGRSPDELERANETLSKVQIQSHVLELRILLTKLWTTADDAYHAYPHEADAYRVQEEVRSDIQRTSVRPLPPPYVQQPLTFP